MVVEEIDGGAEDEEKKSVTVGINTAPFAYETDRNVCQEVDARLVNNPANRKLCETYLNLPLVKQTNDNGSETCDVAQTKIPKTLFTVSKESDEKSLTSVAIEAQNPDWTHEHYSDDEAQKFIVENCGDDVANAYQCLAPPAYRADLFRFCALYTKGGMYMDADIMPLVKLEDLYDPCAVATVGHDWPQGRPQKQMKILAGQQGAPIFLCMINKIVTNVKNRFYPENPLALTGPMVLHDCYEENNEGVSVTYRDTRDAAYPYSGMRGGENGDLLAFEVPHSEGHNYKIDFDLHAVYRPTCPLHAAKEPVAAKSASM